MNLLPTMLTIIHLIGLSFAVGAATVKVALLPAPSAAAPTRRHGWPVPALDSVAARWVILALAVAGVVTAIAALALHALW
jgi:hypothetical protein